MLSLRAQCNFAISKLGNLKCKLFRNDSLSPKIEPFSKGKMVMCSVYALTGATLYGIGKLACAAQEAKQEILGLEKENRTKEKGKELKQLLCKKKKKNIVVVHLQVYTVLGTPKV